MINRTKLFCILCLTLSFGAVISCSAGTDSPRASETSPSGSSTPVEDTDDGQPKIPGEATSGTSPEASNQDNGSVVNPPDVIEPPVIVDPIIETGPVLKPLDFSPNDVTILFPAPSNQSDMTKMLRLTDFDSERVMPQDVFDRAMAIATGPFGTVKNTRHKIGFRSTPQRNDWIISGIRIDPGAPGLSEDIFDKFGKSPQIRLVVQPVRNNGGALDVEDISLHLVYAYHRPDQAGACSLHNVPDMSRFTNAVNDLKVIKDRFATEHNINLSLIHI